MLSYLEDGRYYPGSTRSIEELFQLGGNRHIPDQSTPFARLDKRQRKILAGSSYYKDPDTGPARMWAWVYSRKPAGQLVANPCMRGYRRWAFPLWDFERLKKAHLYGDPSLRGVARPGEFELEKYSTLDSVVNLAATQKERWIIWRNGGTGWYAPDDLTKIEWSKDRLYFNKVAEPASPDLAKRFIIDYDRVCHGKWTFQKWLKRVLTNRGTS